MAERGLKLNDEDRERVQAVREAVRLAKIDESSLIEQYQREHDARAVVVSKGRLKEYYGMEQFADWVLGEEGEFNGRKLSEGGGHWTFIEGLLESGRQRVVNAREIITQFPTLGSRMGENR